MKEIKADSKTDEAEIQKHEEQHRLYPYMCKDWRGRISWRCPLKDRLSENHEA